MRQEERKNQNAPLDVEQHSEGDEVLLGETCVVDQQTGPERSCTKEDDRHFDNLSKQLYMNNASLKKKKNTASCRYCSRHYRSGVAPAWAAAWRRPAWRVAAWWGQSWATTARICSQRGERSSSPAGAAKAAPPRSPAAWGSEEGGGGGDGQLGKILKNLSGWACGTAPTGWEIYWTHSDLSPQHRHNLPHHADQVFVFVRVVGEPDGLTDGQDFFTHVAKREKKTPVYMSSCTAFESANE